MLEVFLGAVVDGLCPAALEGVVSRALAGLPPDAWVESGAGERRALRAKLAELQDALALVTETFRYGSAVVKLVGWQPVDSRSSLWVA